MKRAACVVLAALVSLPAVAGAGMRARYGGELRVLVPSTPQGWDPARIASPSEVAAAGLVYGRLFGIDADGTLSPELATALPEAEAAGRLFRIRLRTGLKFQDGSAVTAGDVVATLGRLANPRAGSPFAAIALPLVGAGEPSGRPSGLVAGPEGEVQASLAFPYPDWPRALAHPAASIVPASWLAARPVGSGPFALGRAGDAEPRLSAFEECPQGRPFADAVRLLASNPRASARALSLGEAEVSLLPGASRTASEGPALFTSYLALNPAHLGAQAGPLRQAIEAAIDVTDLTRFFVRAPAVAMHGLLPPALDGVAAARPRPARPQLPPGMQVTLVYDASVDDHRAVADRLQLKLHDAGVTVQVRRLARAEFQQALAAGGHDLALVSFAALPEPGMALAQVVQFAQGRDAAREELRAIGAGADERARRSLASARAAALLPKLPLVPLYAQAPVASARPGLTPIAFDGSGVPSLADAWFGAAPRGR